MDNDEKGLRCLDMAREVAGRLARDLGAEAREELASAILPGIWQRVRRWRKKRGAYSFEEFLRTSAWQSAKDELRKRKAPNVLNSAAPLENFEDLI